MKQRFGFGARYWCALLTAFGVAGCYTEGFEKVDGETMGTYYVVQANCGADEILASVQPMLDRVNGSMSTYDSGSQLSELNRAPTDEWLPVSNDVHRVLSIALELAAASGGAFDVTVGPLVALWGFGPERRAGVPSADRIAEVAARVGYQHLTLRDEPRALRKSRPVIMDLSAIAKGYAVDLVSEALSRRGCTRHLVDIGGEVRAAGRSARGSAWRVGIEKPDPGQRGVLAGVLNVEDAAIATSGDYRNFIEVEGQRYSHTIDPTTGAPVTHSLASVTVVHSTAVWADGYATLLNVLGPQRGLEFAEREGLAAYFLVYSPPESAPESPPESPPVTDAGLSGHRSATGFEARYTERMKPFIHNSQAKLNASASLNDSIAP